MRELTQILNNKIARRSVHYHKNQTQSSCRLKAYFILQFHLLNRTLRDAGIRPWLAYLLLAVVFIGFSLYLFYKTEYAAYLYAIIALSIAAKLSEIRRNDFLKLCFGGAKLKQLRITENLILITPFLVFLLCYKAFLIALMLLVLGVLLSVVNFRTTLNFVIPTPFYKRPFEFATGFRNTYYVIFAAYVLTIIAAVVSNFNLGIFALLLLFTVTLTYYIKPEHPYYVWIFGMNARTFLLEKIKTAVLYAGMLVLPIMLMLGIFFPQHIAILLAFCLLGFAYVACMIVSKYAAYPDELNITQGVLVALCIWLPPLLIIMIPYLFRKSQHRLTYLLP